MTGIKPSTILTSRQLNQDVSAAKRAVSIDPVIITDRGTPSLVLMTYEDYRKLGKQDQPDGAQFLQKISMQEDIDFGFERLNFEPRPAEF
ncbi:type II toxin-antitoxin system prevent-host-death family antitoxin [Rothia nasimurium]|uniref:type II toxin-antitoxin system prevent-host-death family antitoxin n=1 Tax=Rothia nasimurium TaxID=85336 RepID=UPI001F01B794|nr:type II toxin-antitoxin system prevent-host-death family antitoxin [Rothia nasimurium]